MNPGLSIPETQVDFTDCLLMHEVYTAQRVMLLKQFGMHDSSGESVRDVACIRCC